MGDCTDPCFPKRTFLPVPVRTLQAWTHQAKFDARSLRISWFKTTIQIAQVLEWMWIMRQSATKDRWLMDVHPKVFAVPWWRHQMETFSALLAICAGNHRSPVNSPHKGQWRGALMFSLICVWLIDWVNNHEADDLRRYRAHYDVTVMWALDSCGWLWPLTGCCSRISLWFVSITSIHAVKSSPSI